MNSDEVQKLVTDWFSQDFVWDLNAPTYPKSKEYVDCLLLKPYMVRNKMVLNIGCCFPSDELQFSETAKSWVAIDISKNIIEKCKEFQTKFNLGKVTFLQMNMTELEFEDKYFDTVIDFSTGDHLTKEAYEVSLKEIYRVLKTKGYFVCTYANLASFPDVEYFGDFGYFRSTSPEEMKKMVEAVGFTVIKTHEEGDRIGLVATK